MLERIYNMYEDEIDDTYDSINEVNGPIDLTSVDDDGSKALDVVRAKKEQTIDPGLLNESDLVHAFVENPSVFERNGTARRSPQREALRKRTNMSDEQLEGWASMFNKNVSIIIIMRFYTYILYMYNNLFLLLFFKNTNSQENNIF